MTSPPFPPVPAHDPRPRSQSDGRPERIVWLPPLVLLVNLAVLGLMMGYSALNLRPDISTVRTLPVLGRLVAVILRPRLP